MYMLFFEHMKMFIASDHRGMNLKNELLPFLNTQGQKAEDLTPPTDTDDRIDFPLVAQAVAKNVANNKDSIGVLICRSGVGVTIAANRFKGVRAANAHSVEEIVLAKHDDHINVLCLSGEQMTAEQAQTIITAWLETKEDNDERRLRRLAQLDEYGS